MAIEVEGSQFFHNAATGADGGDGLGGGVAVVDGGSVDIDWSIIIGNQARGGSGGDTNGEGLGGGAYNNGSASDFEIDSFSLFLLRFNSASDDGDDIFGLFDS